MLWLDDFLSWADSLYFKMYDCFSIYGAVVAHLLHNVAIAFFYVLARIVCVFCLLSCSVFPFSFRQGAPESMRFTNNCWCLNLTSKDFKSCRSRGKIRENRWAAMLLSRVIQ